MESKENIPLPEPACENSQTKEVRPKVYQVGTLRYTTYSLAVLFLWLLWGDFCYIMLESIIPRILPLLMKKFHASNQLIGFILGSLPSIIGITIMPILGVISDRHRGRWGRRIPFLLVTSPFAALFLILIGFSDKIGAWLHADVLSNFIEASPASVALATLCSLAAIFYFFNGFMSAMYNYLLPDVVPQQVMGRFISFFRTVGILGGVVFSRYVFVKWETNQHEIFLGVGLIYLATFLLMCWRVKEGEYPPPTKDFEKKGMVHNIKTYFRECFSVSFYRWIFLLITLMTLVYCAPFSMLFFQETLKLSADEMGKFIGWTYLFMGIATPLAGIICDKFHVVRVLPVALLAVAVMHFTCFVAVHDLTTLYIYGFLTVLPGAFVGICQSTICILLLPKPKYGQYMSAMGIIVSIGVIFGNYLAGLFFDIFHNYQLMYIWNGTFEVLACVASAVIFLNWKKLGGATNYVCPETALTAATPDGPPDLR